MSGQTPKAYRYRVYSRAGAFLGTWLDATEPNVSVSMSGVGDMTLTVPRIYGAADEPQEPGSSGTLQDGNVIEAVVVDADGTEYIVWRGDLLNWEFTGDGTVTVKAAALARRRELAPIHPAFDIGETNGINPLSYYSNAQQLVTDRIGSGVWHPSNAASARVDDSLPSPGKLVNESVMSGVRKLAADGGYLAWVDALGLIRVADLAAFPSSIGLTRHVLHLGSTAHVARLRKSADARYRHVILTGGGGITAQAKAGDWVVGDAAYMETRSEIVTVGKLQAAANLKLSEVNVVALNVNVTVYAEAYPIETFQVGDTVRLVVPRALPTGTDLTGYEDFNDRDLRVVAYRYTPNAIVLTMDRATPTPAQQSARLGAQADHTAAAVADRAPIRDQATPTDLTHKSRVAFADGVAALPAGKKIAAAGDWLDTRSIPRDRIIIGAVGADEIDIGAVGTPELAAASVTRAKLETYTTAGTGVGTANVEAGAITRPKIAAAAVGQAELDAGSVVRSKLETYTAAGTGVGTTNIEDGAVTGPKLPAGAVTRPKLGVGAVGIDEIDVGAVGNAELGAGAVDNVKTAFPAQATVTGGGTAAAVPTTPVTWIKVRAANGTDYVVPAYTP